MAMATSLVSVNVNGLRDANKRLGFLHWLSQRSPFFVCLQETHAVFTGRVVYHGSQVMVSRLLGPSGSTSPVG